MRAHQCAVQQLREFNESEDVKFVKSLKLPRALLAISTELTGTQKEALVMADLWDLDHNLVPQEKHIEEESVISIPSIRNSIRNHFEREHSLRANFTTLDISEVHFDAIGCVLLEDDGVRFIEPDEMAALIVIWPE